MPFVVFACVGNSCRSQMAAAWARHLGGPQWRVESAGTDPAVEVNPLAVEVMAEVGIDISEQRPQLLTEAMVTEADHIISMGCDVAGRCPYFLFRQKAVDWGLEDPVNRGIEVMRRTRDEIKELVEGLINAGLRN